VWAFLFWNCSRVSSRVLNWFEDLKRACPTAPSMKRDELVEHAHQALLVE